MIMDVRLGYRNKGDPMKDWKEIARSHEERKLKCTITKAGVFIIVKKYCVYLELMILEDFFPSAVQMIFLVMFFRSNE